MSARMLLLLALVVWSRLWAGVPESVTHADADPEHGFHEVIDHVTVLEHDRAHTAEPGPQSLEQHKHADHLISDGAAGAADEHHHHLHACGASIAALLSAELGIDLTLTSDPVAIAVNHQSDRLPERLLRPPAV